MVSHFEVESAKQNGSACELLRNEALSLRLQWARKVKNIVAYNCV